MRSPAILPRFTYPTIRLGFLALAAAAALGLAPSRAAAADLTATTSTLSSVFAGAQPGDVIRLAAGNYGTFSGGSKAGMVTITAQTGASVTMSADLGSSQNITIDGLTISGSTVGTTSAPGQHIHFTNNTFTKSTVIRTPTNANIDVVYDDNTFASINANGYEGRIEVVGNGNNSSTNNGVVLQNNTFGPNGCSDGVQLTAGVSGTRILGNEFRNIKQGSCSPWHVDPIQFYGGQYTTISGNWFHGNSTGIMSPDGNGSPMTISNNVFQTDGEYAQQIVIGGGSGDAITHNTFSNGAQIRIGKVNVGASSNETIKDNVITGGFWYSESQSTSGFTIDYNLVAGGGGGTHGINGSPTYAGGSSPATYAGFALASGSNGAGAASDGTNMGIATGVIVPAPPDTTITTGPASSTTSTSATLAFSGQSASGGAVTFTCSLDGAAFANCTSPVTYSGLSVGAHTFQARATDTAGLIDASPAARSWTITAPDTTPPDTTITSGPSGSTTSTTASLAFSATEPVTFECRMDAGAWASCTSPMAYSGLAVGSHTVDVRATDLAGNTDLTPASRAWSVTAAADTTPPDTSIVSGPSGSTTSTTASLAFSATESATFECRLDAGAWSACTSPKAYTGLAVGVHTFDVRATDTAGNTDLSPASRGWTVTAPSDTTAPDTTITSGPTGSGPATSAALAFTASEAGSTFECRLDGGTWASCPSPKSYAAMAVGAHTFDVRATDAAGNIDASPATRTWTVTAAADTTPPDTAITGGPAASTTETTATTSFTSTESGSTFQCRLDGGAWSACASPEGDSGLAVGVHAFDVRATDAAGNVDATPATRTWTIVAPAPPPPTADTTAPDTSLTSGPTTVTTSRSATFEFTATESPATYSCSLDGSRWSRCTSPKSYSSLSRSKHTVRVRATDAAGNTDATPVSYSWTIVRRSYGTTYSFEPLSGGSRTPVQADSLEGACALVPNHRARLGVRLGGLSVRRSHRAFRISGKVPELAQDGVNARIRVSVRSHGRWHLLASRRVHVRFDGSFRVKAPRRGGKLKVTAVARCG